MQVASRIISYLFLLLVLISPFFVWWVANPEHKISPVLFSLLLLHIVAVLIIFSILQKNEEKTRNKRAQELFSTNEQFVSLYERSPIPYLTLDNKGLVTMYNPAAIRLFSATSDVMIGLKFADHLAMENEDELSVLLGKLMSDYVVVDTEVQLLTVGGTVRWILLSVFVYEVGGQRLVSMIDITHQKAVDAAKTEFVALATHQLRTPIAAIRWNVELLDKSFRDSKNDAQARYIQKIDRNVQRMLALINDFLSVSKLEMGTFATTWESINLTEFIDAIVDEYNQSLVEQQIVFQRDEQPQNLIYVTDPRLLHIIISNLLSNAVKYVRAEGSIIFSYLATGSKLVITVSDTGIGVPLDEQGKVFSKFFRARNAYLHYAVGTGLGLYIVKQSAEKLGGTIEFVSSEGKGTTFVVTLPYQNN